MKRTNAIEILFDNFFMEERPDVNEVTPANEAKKRFDLFMDPIIKPLGIDAENDLYMVESQLYYEAQKEAYFAGFAAAMSLINNDYGRNL